MPYYVVDDWSGGLDCRRMPVVASPTTLVDLVNAHINPGGEIEKRKAFVQHAAANNTFGLAVVQDELTVFGTDAVSPLPPGSPLNYMQLDAPATNVTKVEDWDLFDGLLYVSGFAEDGQYHHFYDGAHVASGRGRHIRTFNEKVYGVLNKDLHFCATSDPTDWAGAGSGTINMSTRDAESLELEGLEIYYDQLAVLSPRNIQMWAMDPDPLQNRQVQVLRAAGTLAGHTARQYGGGDVLYLDASGVRSLRARDSSNAASVSDVGSPIDKIMQQQRQADLAGYREAIATVEQGTGRFWLHLNGQIYVLSHFPGPKVTAWSRYVPQVPIVDMVYYGLSVAVRGLDDQIYIYGGENYDTYDDSPVTAITPFLSIDKPATDKDFTGVDISGENWWQVDACYSPQLDLTDDASWTKEGLFDGTTYNMEQMALAGAGSHVAFRLTCDRDGPALLSNLAVHYNQEDSG